MGDVFAADQRDLLELPAERWSQLDVPDGWEPVAEMCHELREGLADRVRDSVEAIRTEVPLYQRSAVPPEDLAASIERNLEVLLLGIAERRGPTEDEIEVRSALGSRRAHQDFPVDALLQAYHVGYRDLWRRFLKYAENHDVSHLLLDAATTMWEWTHRVTDGIGRAHAETTQLLAVRATSTRHRFLELLLAGDTDAEELHTLCRSLGYDARGHFRATVVCEAGASGPFVPRFQAELDLHKGTHQAILHGPRVIVLSQDDDRTAVEATVTRLFPRAVTGVGFPRPGLAGARVSVGDAERAADATDEPGVHSFERAWMWAVLSREAERLHCFLEPGRAVAADNGPLAETITAFAEHGFSISAAAAELHIHPNTAAYRLKRWFDLTGWDPRTYEGLTRSLAALRLTDRTLTATGPVEPHP